MREDLPLLAFDEIPKFRKDAKEITRIIKKGNQIVGYELAGEMRISKEEAISMAKSGEIKNVGIAHKKDTVYLKSIPDPTGKNNLSNLATLIEE